MRSQRLEARGNDVNTAFEEERGQTLVELYNDTTLWAATGVQAGSIDHSSCRHLNATMFVQQT